jgi:hypothetical protein
VLVVVVFFAAITEFITSKNEMIPSFGHVFFLGMMMTKIDNVFSGLIIVFLSGVIPNLMLGSMNMLKITSYVLQFVSVILFSFFPQEGTVIIGLILAVLCYTLTFIIAKSAGSTLPELVIDAIIPMVLNIFYFVSFATPVLHIVGNLILG